MVEKEPKTNKGKKKQSKEPSNVVEEKRKKPRGPKKETAEDRANKELDNIAAYQARLAKKKNKQKRIRAIVDDDKFASNRRGIL